jgi:hypothetical protein
MRTARKLQAEWWQVLRGSVGTGTKERRFKYLERLGCWISTCYGPFSFSASFETYEPIISLIFNFWGPM